MAEQHKPKGVIEYTEGLLRYSNKDNDLVHAEIFRVIREGRGEDFAMPTNKNLFEENLKLRQQLNYLLFLLTRRQVRPSIFGSELKKIRLELGMTQTIFADLIPVNQTLISKLETGGRQITEETLYGIVTAHQLNPEQTRRLYRAAGFYFEPPSLIP